MAAAVIAVALVVATSSLAAENPDGVAVIIGNKSYQGSIPSVDFAHNDADAFKQFVVEGLGFDPDNVIDLRDATQAQMESAFGNERTHKGALWRYLDPNGNSDVVVFYSGHGVPSLEDEQAYLLPVDADPNVPQLNGYPLDVLYANLAKLETRSVKVFLEACFSGTSQGGVLVRGAMGMVVNERPPEQAAGLLVLTAAASDQIASWDEKAGHGLFTMNLLAALAGAADRDPTGDGNGDVTLGEVKAYLDRHMTRAARRIYAREQTATAQGAGDMVLATYTPGETVPPPAEPLFVVEEMDLDMYALKNARVRAGPTTTVEVLTTLDKGSRVMVTGKVDGRDWYRVALANGDVGFVFGKLLGEDAPGDETQVAVGVYPQTYNPGDVFSDCPFCPEMVVVPKGSFRMGALNVSAYTDAEKPVHRVTIPKPFAVGVYEVTRGEFARFVSATGHDTGTKCWTFDYVWSETSGRSWRQPGYDQIDRDPAVCVNWKDAQAYVLWLSRTTDNSYRLLSEAEWEYVARAGTRTRYWYGNDRGASQLCTYGNGAARETSLARKNDACDDGFDRTAPVGSFPANSFGLHDVHGNVWEWVEDCNHKSYEGAPSNGRAWTTGGDCGLRVMRGGSWRDDPGDLRVANRFRFGVDYRYNDIGFRVARTLLPLVP